MENCILIILFASVAGVWPFVQICKMKMGMVALLAEAYATQILEFGVTPRLTFH